MMRSRILWAGLASSHVPGHQEANSILNSALSSDDPITRFYGANAFYLATEDAGSWLPAMKSALSDAFESKSVAVPLQYLARMGGAAKEALPELNKLLWHPDDNTRLFTALAIKKISTDTSQ